MHSGILLHFPLEVETHQTSTEIGILLPDISISVLLKLDSCKFVLSCITT